MALGSKMWLWVRRIAIGFLALLLLLVLVGAVYEFFARRGSASQYPAPGVLVDIGGRSIHLDCRGDGAPTVVLESGLDMNGSLAWHKVHDTLAKTTRTCAYDRAGIMWSDPSPDVRDGDHVARDLHAALTAAGIDGPLVLVGHSLGGPYIMNYTRQFGASVDGLVFVDASHPDQLETLAKPGEKKLKVELPLAVEVLSTLGWTGLPRALSGVLSPDEDSPIAPLREAYTPSSLPAMLDELESLETTLDQGGALRTLGDRPIVVLTGSKPYSKEILAAQEMTEAEGRVQMTKWLDLHRDEARWSTRSTHEILPDAGHYVQLDRPDAVIKAVTAVVDQVRSNPRE
ncbi:MAG: alpha/beta hydrolase [Pseudomonadota bacterium]|jgi:pimeloyl-ACP methyl ester carboxylesterase|nr:alpha/beta hydrolase [Pseudomonadota bacterium]